MDVVLLRWPAELDRRAVLRERHVPRLLLVDVDAEPPEPDDCLEDWIRATDHSDDVQRRLEWLRRRAGQHLGPVPSLDDDGVLRVGESWVSLPPVEARLTAALVERLGAVVSREALARSGWPHGAPGRNALDVHVLRLRRRLARVGLVIRTVRSRGYLLERSDSRPEHLREPERPPRDGPAPESTQHPA